MLLQLLCVSLSVARSRLIHWSVVFTYSESTEYIPSGTDTCIYEGCHIAALRELPKSLAYSQMLAIAQLPKLYRQIASYQRGVGDHRVGQ